MEITENADMSAYSSFKAGGCADLLMIPENTEELTEALDRAESLGAPFLILGNGTDTLFTDGGYRGTVIKLGKGFEEIRAEGNALVCGAAALLSKAAKAAQERSLSGLERVSGIPGSIGGAVFMNAGAYGGEIKDVVSEVTVLGAKDHKVRTIPAEDLDLSYRHSVLAETGDVALSAKFALTPAGRAEIDALMKELTEKRNAKQPLDKPSCGSFFKRPEGYFAGTLIEEAGLKGVAVGGAAVSSKHAGFIVNEGGATATDIIRLMRLVQNTVLDKAGVRLEPEVRIIGEMPD